MCRGLKYFRTILKQYGSWILPLGLTSIISPVELEKGLYYEGIPFSWLDCAVQQSWRGFHQWLHTNLKWLHAYVFTPSQNSYPTEIGMASPLVMGNLGVNLMGYIIIWQVDPLTCLWGIILIRPIVLGKPTYGGWHHSLAWTPRLYKKENVGWTQTFRLVAFVFIWTFYI